MEFSTENLLQVLSCLQESINAGKIDQTAQAQIWDAVMWNGGDPESRELLKYLFTGWWAHRAVINMN